MNNTKFSLNENQILFMIKYLENLQRTQFGFEKEEEEANKKRLKKSNSKDQKENTEKKKEIKEEKMDKDIYELNDQCKIYKNIIDNVKQPNSYLITNLKDREIEIYRLKQELLNNDEEIIKLKKISINYSSSSFSSSTSSFFIIFIFWFFFIFFFFCIC